MRLSWDSDGCDDSFPPQKNLQSFFFFLPYSIFVLGMTFWFPPNEKCGRVDRIKLFWGSDGCYNSVTFPKSHEVHEARLLKIYSAWHTESL